MTPQEIEKLFDGAPQGATHWMPESCEWLEGFWRRVGTANYFYEKGKWVFSGGKPFGHPNLVERPSPSWSGEGLPPVDVECEYQRNDVTYKQAWVAVTPLYIGESITVLKHSASGNEFTEMTASCVFRPIRTPEQIAADEREAAISEACEDIRNTIHALAGYIPTDGAALKVVRAMIEAGYRKQDAK